MVENPYSLWDNIIILYVERSDIMSKNSGTWLNKTSVKSIILAVFPIIISILCSLLSNWDVNQPHFILKIASFSIISLLYITLLIYYAKSDSNLKYANDILTKQNNAFRKVATSSANIFNESAKGLNLLSHSIVEESKIDMNIWSFDKAVMGICKGVYELICNISGGEQFGVTYVKLLESPESTHCVKTVGFYNNSSIPPHVFGKSRCIDDSHGYYDTKLFAKDNPDISIISTPKEIFELFEFENRTEKTGKYSQYIGYPVICNDKTMIGLIQVVSYGNQKIASCPEDLQTIAKKYLSQFAFLSVFLSKVEKGLLSMPNINVRKRI